MGVLTDPFIGGRGNPIRGRGGAIRRKCARTYASNGAAFEARTRRLRGHLSQGARDGSPFAQRWAVWAAAYGGSQSTDGNAPWARTRRAASWCRRRRRLSFLAGHDCRICAGRRRHQFRRRNGSARPLRPLPGRCLPPAQVGPAYITAALAYGWQDITTDRAVTIAGVDRLRAQFHANAWSGRLEGGYRFTSQGLAGTPYAAGQFTTFDLPAYAEQAESGSNAFALSYAGKTVTASQRTRPSHGQIIRDAGRHLHPAGARGLGAQLQHRS